MAARQSRQSDDDDRRFMHAALELAIPGLGRTGPNPTVGCVIVRNRRIVGRGATAPNGRPHAETIALDDAGKLARGATAYVTLEPCAHQGHTPPCARALSEASVSRVVVGCVDPYPAVRGRGIAMLRRAGIAVTVPLLEKECRQLNAGFFMRVTRGRPLVTLKLAMTLDGRIATAGGDSRWVTSAQARELVHRMRSESDAILVGAGTVIADNPRLTSRIEGGHDPLRVIVDGRLRVSPSALVFRQRSAAGAILATSRRNAARAHRRYGSTRVEVIAVPEKTGPGKIGALSMAGLMTELGKRGINRVMIEGGALTAGSALQEGVVDRLAVFIAPKILGGGLPGVEGIATRQMRDAIGLSELAVRKIGDDLLVEAEVVSSMLSAVRARRRKDTP